MRQFSYSLYRKFIPATLVCFLTIAALNVSAATYSELELKKTAQLITDSPKLRQSLAQLKERAKGKDVETRIVYGKALVSVKQIEEGITVFNTVNSDKEPKVLMALAVAYRLKNVFTEEVRVLEILKKSQPQSEFVHTSLATAYLSTKNTPKAIEVLREFIKLQPKRKAAYLQLFDIYESIKNSYEIRNLLADMKERFSNDPEVYTKYCQYYAVGGFLEQANESCTTAISLDSKVAENHVYLGITKKNLKQNEQAEKIIKKAAQQFPTSELAQFSAGQLSDETKNWEMSVRYYKKCIDHHASSDRCHRGLGKSAFEAGKYDLALKSFSVACNKDISARNEFRTALTVLRNKNKNDVADEYAKHFERCGISQ